MAKPSTDFPTWATDAGADIDTPPTQQQDLGWVEEDIPPAGWINWFWNLIGAWINWLSTTLPVFDTLEEAATEIAAGDLGIVFENDTEFLPGTKLLDGATPAVALADVCVTGDGVLYAPTGAGSVSLTSRADLDTVIRTFGAGIGVVRLCTDGIRVYAAYGNFVNAWTIATGVVAWAAAYDHGATVHDICVYGGRLFLVGGSGTGTKHARGLLAETGIAQWSYQHSSAVETLHSCIAVNGRLIVAGDTSTFGSAANVRALYYANGNDLANEGGTAADSTGNAWDQAFPNDINARRLLTTDGRRLFLGDETAGEILTVGIADGDVEKTKAMAGLTFNALSADQDYVFLAATGGGVGHCYAFDAATLALAWNAPYTGDDVAAVATDGAAVFIGLQATALDPLQRLNRGNRAHTFRKPVIGGGGSDVFQVNPRVINPE